VIDLCTLAVVTALFYKTKGFLAMQSRFGVLILWLLAINTIWFSSLLSAQYRGADRPKLVVVDQLTFEYESSLIEAVGTAQAKRSVTLFASVSDAVTTLNIAPGEAVKKGDVLVELDSRLQDVEIRRAKIELEVAERNLTRLKKSLKQGAATERELDDADTTFRLAEVQLQEALENKENRLVRAPFDGVLGLTDVEVGDRITPQTEITTLDDRSTLFVNFVAPELAVAYLMEKPDVTLQPWTNRAISLSAAIAEIDSRVNIADRTIRARAQLTNEADQYRPGMSFRVTLNVRGEAFVAIPEAALSWGANGAFVWLALDGKAKRVEVQVEQRLRGRILVTGNLSDGETLITEGIQGLRDGQALKIQNAPNQGNRANQKQAESKATS
jgi:RND family efflux transporter MFP subunit